MKEFVDKNFYMDDGLISLSNSEKAIDLMQRTEAMLATANLCVHKIASNDLKVSGKPFQARIDPFNFEILICLKILYLSKGQTLLCVCR